MREQWEQQDAKKGWSNIGWLVLFAFLVTLPIWILLWRY